MGNLYDYFAAPSDEEALTALVLGGPAVPDEKTGKLLFDAVDMKGTDPIVNLAELVAILTGRDYEEIAGLADHGRLLEDSEDEDAEEADEQWVVAACDVCRDALADAAPDRLKRAAETWVAAEPENDADPAHLGEALVDLAALARRARDSGQGLYCWMSL